MNPAFRALQKRNQKLELQNAALRLTFDRMLSDIEMTESLGCAYAWELAQTMWKWVKGHDHSSKQLYVYECRPDIEKVARSFAAAVEAGANFQEARKWLRDSLKKDATFKKTAIEAAGKDPNMELETPFGRYSLRTLTAT